MKAISVADLVIITDPTLARFDCIGEVIGVDEEEAGVWVNFPSGHQAFYPSKAVRLFERSKKQCVWKAEEGWNIGCCDNSISFEAAADFAFCPYCGKETLLAHIEDKKMKVSIDNDAPLLKR